MDGTLVGLQEGLARDTVGVRGIQEEAQQCTNCGWTDSTPDKTGRAVVGPAFSLPYAPCCRGSPSYKVPLEIIADGNGEKLRSAGGIGALLK